MWTSRLCNQVNWQLRCSQWKYTYMVSWSPTSSRWLYLHSRRHPKKLRHQSWSRLCCPCPRLPDHRGCLSNKSPLHDPLMVWTLRCPGFCFTTFFGSSNTKLSIFLPHWCETSNLWHQNDLMGHPLALGCWLQPLNCYFLPLKVPTLRCWVIIRQRVQRWHCSLCDWSYYCSHHCAQRRRWN